jgi:HPt (histidine-containing phosphotransfer) domain-containing protein
VSAHRRPPGARDACAGLLPTAESLAGDPDFQQLVAAFVETLRGRADALEAALGGDDLAQVGTIAHQLRGTARSYGFAAITDEATAVERSARLGRLDEVRPHVGTLVGLCRRARPTTAFATD